MKSIDLSKNIGITSCALVQEICKPLYDFLGITYFNYVKINSDGSRSTITDRPDFIITYYKSPELQKTKGVIQLENSIEPCFKLSREFRNQPSFAVARNDFDIGNGITILFPTSEGKKEIYHFGTTTKNNKEEFYGANVDLFYKFISYFKDRACELILKADNEAFSLDTKDESPSSFLANDPFLEIRNNFIRQLPINRYFIEGLSQKNHLTKREMESLDLLIKLGSSKKIARSLGISNRTVESYLASAKTKFGCHTKEQLLFKLLSVGANKLFPFLLKDKDDK